jgi:G3E family GTPase
MKIMVLEWVSGSGKTSILTVMAEVILKSIHQNRYDTGIIANEIGQSVIDNQFLSGKGYTVSELLKD